MLADFYIPSLSNDMKIVEQKNNLVGKILYRNLVHSKKTTSKREYMTKKIEERVIKFSTQIQTEYEKLKASDDPDDCERIPKLMKLNFKPMDDIWRSRGIFWR